MLELDKFATRFREDRSGILILSALVGFGLSIVLIGRLIFSGFSILDDHTIAGWLGAQRHVSLKDLGPMLASTEIGQFGTGPRFRPVMYCLIVFQTWLWGPHPAGFHLLPIIWFGIFLWSAAWASFRSIGIIAGCAILFLIANGHYWGNIFTHSTLVSEQIDALGLGLVVFGFGLTMSWFVDGCRSRLDAAVLLVSFGSLICLGAKENFMPLLGLDILLVAGAWRMKRIGSRTLAIAIVLILLDFVICYGILVPNVGKTTDMYGYDNSVSYRLRMIHHSPLIWRVAIAFAAAAAAIQLGWRRMQRNDDRNARSIMALGTLLLVGGLYLTWEIFFYAGRLPAGQRYDFPSLLIDPLLAGAALYAIVRVSAATPWLNQRFSTLALQVCFALLILNVATAYYVLNRALPILGAIQISNDHTNLMREDLVRGRELTAQHPDWPVIVNPSYPFDYEAVVTFPLWLRYFQISNPASVLVDIPAQNIKSPFEQSLVDTMKEKSRSGQTGVYVARSAAIEKAQAEGHCYVVEFQNRNTPCVPLPYRPSEYYPVD